MLFYLLPSAQTNSLYALPFMSWFSEQSMDNPSSCAAPASSPRPRQVFLEYDSFLMDMDHCPNIFECSGLDQAVTQYSESESKLKRNSPSETTNPTDTKRLADHRYRQKRREEIKRTKVEVDDFRSELSRLTQENEILKMEMLNKNNTLQCQEEMIRQLKQSFDQLNTQNISQSVIVRVISEKLYSTSDVDLQQENANLKKQIDHLMSFIDNPNKLEIFKLEQDKAELEHEMRILKVIVEALCEKIHHHETHQSQQQLQ